MTYLKSGDFVCSSPGPENEFPIRLFDNVSGSWFGTVINFTPRQLHHRPTKYNHLEVLLASHDGIIRGSWLTDGEITTYIKVLFSPLQ